MSLDAGTFFQVLEREAQRILPHRRLWVMLRVDRSNPDHWTLAFTSPAHPATTRQFPLHGVSFSANLLANRPTLVADLATTTPLSAWEQLIVDDGGRGAIVAPVCVASRILGGLLFAHSAPDAYTLADIALIEPVAGLLALALEHERLDQQASTLAVVEERNRLAREIHDTLAQSLTAIILNLGSLKLEGHTRSTTEVGILDETETLARSALLEARRSVLGLRPTSLMHQSLGQALAQELAAFGRRERVTTHLYIHGGERELAPSQMTALFRIAQEAFQNIAKYAQARSVEVELSFAAGAVTLTIKDDGVGFVSTALTSPTLRGGSGLLVMRERASTLGGSMDVQSSPGYGTLVQATLPYTDGAGVTTPTADKVAPQLRPTRVLIVDDHPVTRQGLRRILDHHADLEVVGEAEDGLAAIDQTRVLRPDVVLLDVQMPRLGGLAAIPQLRAVQPRVEIVVLTTFNQEENVLAALTAGARGFLLKDAAPEILLATIHAAARGKSLLPLEVATRVVERMAALASRNTNPDSLNPRELEILQLLATGAPYKEIGGHLHITTKTVQYHVSNILGKLHVRSRSEAVAVATERGLLNSGG